MPTRRLVLASTSPRRRQLLATLGVEFELLDPGVHEPDDQVPPGGALGHAREMAHAKAAAAADRLAAAPRDRPLDILASDTVVEAAGQLLGKPADRADAIRILSTLSGTDHIVATAVCLLTLDPDGRRREQLEIDITRIRFRALTRAEIEAYVDTGESFGKAGAYAVQEHGDQFVARIDGEFSTVVGLPVPLVARLLHAAGYALTPGD